MSKQEQFKQLETIATELIGAFTIAAPPVPVESMLQKPLPEMWETVDITQLSGTFLSIRDHYSPRMSLARLLARHAAVSAWGKQRGLPALLRDEDLLRAFARMLVMPAEMVNNLTSGARNAQAMSMHFEVPVDDARLRLQELALYS
jgi:hypothetical protein